MRAVQGAVCLGGRLLIALSECSMYRHASRMGTENDARFLSGTGMQSHKKPKIPVLTGIKLSDVT